MGGCDCAGADAEKHGSPGYGPKLMDDLKAGLQWLQEQGTWKSWRFRDVMVYDASTFRKSCIEHFIPQELHRHLPVYDAKANEETPAQVTFRKRMEQLLEKGGHCLQSGLGRYEGEDPSSSSRSKGLLKRGGPYILKSWQLQEEGAAEKETHISCINLLLEELMKVSVCRVQVAQYLLSVKRGECV